MFLLDTDTLIHWLRRNAEVRAKVALAGRARVSASAISIAELAWGAFKSARVADGLAEIEAIEALCDVHPCDAQVARRFGEIRALLEREGNRIEDMDLLIAATALAHGLVLVSGNRRHFDRVPGLQVESWVQR